MDTDKAGVVGVGVRAEEEGVVAGNKDPRHLRARTLGASGTSSPLQVGQGRAGQTTGFHRRSTMQCHRLHHQDLPEVARGHRVETLGAGDLALGLYRLPRHLVVLGVPLPMPVLTGGQGEVTAGGTKGLQAHLLIQGSTCQA